MPTCYTAAIEDGTDLTLRGFALRAARAMMPLITLRDAPAGTPTPRRLEPNTAYHDEQLAAAMARLDALRAMTDAQILAALDAHNAGVRADRARAVANNDITRQRYTGMLGKVRAWNGPEGLKDFMTAQVESSMSYEVSDDPLKYVQTETPTADTVMWHNRNIEAENQNVAYHTEKIRAEHERTAQRNAWLDALWASLPEESKE